MMLSAITTFEPRCPGLPQFAWPSGQIAFASIAVAPDTTVNPSTRVPLRASAIVASLLCTVVTAGPSVDRRVTSLVTCTASWYVPGQIEMVSPSCAAATAAWIVGKLGAAQPGGVPSLASSLTNTSAPLWLKLQVAEIVQSGSH